MEDGNISVLHVTTATRRLAPGIFEAVAGITGALAEEPGFSVRVLAATRATSGSAEAECGRAAWRHAPTQGPSLISYTPALADRLAWARPQIVHQHGLWQFPGWCVARFCRQEAVPLIVSPHGMLSESALGSRSLRKRAAWLVYQRAVMAAASLIHVTSPSELHAVRRLGIHAPIAMIPHGVTAPVDCPSGGHRAGHRALFLGRIDPMKGVGDLVAAWALVRPKGWRLTIAGPDDRGYGRTIRREIDRHALGGTVEVTDAVYGEARESLFASVNLLILPSYTENFGLVVAEALSRAVPVVTTTATPWQRIEAEDCGWVCDPGVDPLAVVLAQALATDDLTLRAMGVRGWQLIRDHYTWAAAARKMAAACRWLMGDSAPPSCLAFSGISIPQDFW